MEREYIAGQELAKKMVRRNKEEASRMRKVIAFAREAQRQEGVAHENDYWLKQGFLDTVEELLGASSGRMQLK